MKKDQASFMYVVGMLSGDGNVAYGCLCHRNPHRY